MNSEDRFIYDRWKATGLFPFNPIHKIESLRELRGVLKRIDSRGRLSIWDIIMHHPNYEAAQ